MASQIVGVHVFGIEIIVWIINYELFKKIEMEQDMKCNNK